MKTLIARVRAWLHHDDPLVGGLNLVAGVIVGNQPFYPFYVLWAVGWAGWPAFAAWAVMPLFAATPAIARASPLWGRIWFCLIATGNTVLTTKLLGPASGVELFHFACIAVGALFFRASERVLMLVMAGMPLALAWLLRDAYGAPVAVLTAEQSADLFTLHAVSVGTLLIFLGIVVSNVMSQAGVREGRS